MWYSQTADKIMYGKTLVGSKTKNKYMTEAKSSNSVQKMVTTGNCTLGNQVTKLRKFFLT